MWEIHPVALQHGFARAGRRARLGPIQLHRRPHLRHTGNQPPGWVIRDYYGPTYDPVIYSQDPAGWNEVGSSTQWGIPGAQAYSVCPGIGTDWGPARNHMGVDLYPFWDFDSAGFPSLRIDLDVLDLVNGPFCWPCSTSS